MKINTEKLHHKAVIKKWRKRIKQLEKENYKSPEAKACLEYEKAVAYYNLKTAKLRCKNKLGPDKKGRLIGSSIYLRPTSWQFRKIIRQYHEDKHNGVPPTVKLEKWRQASGKGKIPESKIPKMETAA